MAKTVNHVAKKANRVAQTAPKADGIANRVAQTTGNAHMQKANYYV